MKHKLTVYHYRYLTVSETFIYRQLQALNRVFDLTLLTHAVENRNDFAGLAPILAPRRSVINTATGRQKRFFLRYLRDSRLFHVNFGHHAVDVQEYAALAGIPMTVYFLGVDASAWLRDAWYRKKLRTSQFAAVFVNSEDMKRRLLPFLPPGTRCHVAYVGIALERFPFQEHTTLPDDGIFLQVSRLVPKKGADISLRAFSLYLRDFPKAELLIAGDGPLRRDLEKLMRSLGIEKSVKFLGSIGYDRYVELLHGAHAYLQPSLTAMDGDMEGLPTAVCEAMASGLPVISTRHSGIPEVIDDGIDGLLANEGDAEGLYARMRQLKESNISRISRQARMKIEQKFDHMKSIESFCRRLTDIIGGNESDAA